MHHKRKRSKRQVCCTMCTKFTWLGNHKERRSVNERAKVQEKLHDAR